MQRTIYPCPMFIQAVTQTYQYFAPDHIVLGWASCASPSSLLMPCGGLLNTGQLSYTVTASPSHLKPFFILLHWLLFHLLLTCCHTHSCRYTMIHTWHNFCTCTWHPRLHCDQWLLWPYCAVANTKHDIDLTSVELTHTPPNDGYTSIYKHWRTLHLSPHY